MDAGMDRQPCPHRIIDDAGGAFAMGAIGGSLFHFLKGVRNSPNGARFIGGSQAMRMNAARTGGNFAAWGALYSAFDCTFVFLRKREDPWNSVFSAAAAGGVLSLRKGLRASASSALMGAVIVGLMEGVMLMTARTGAQLQKEQQDAYDQAMVGQASGMPGFPEGYLQGQVPAATLDNNLGQDPSSSSSSSSSWFGRIFSGRKQQDPPAGTSSTTEVVLENFDLSPPPIPSFEFK